MILVKKYTFEAAHRLPRLPESHKCFRLHGHSFGVDLVIEGPVDPGLGWVLDFDEISQAWGPLFDLLDHRYLNEVEGLDNPTSENLAIWVFDRLRPRLASLRTVIVHETCNARCEYSGPAS